MNEPPAVNQLNEAKLQANEEQILTSFSCKSTSDNAIELVYWEIINGKDI